MDVYKYTSFSVSSVNIGKLSVF